MNTCYGPDCNRTPKAYGLCDTHRRQQREGRPLTPARRYANSADLVEDALWLRETGEHPERAAARLGTTMTALDKALRRAGHPWPALIAAIKHARDTAHAT